VPIAVPVAAYADISSDLCTGANLQTTAGAGCTNSSSTTTLDNILTTVVQIFSLVVGVVAVIMIIIGGLKYITSGGDSGNISSAKNTIIYAIIGLIIVALAQVIVHFVLNKVSGS
jgi:hypothetical protein